MDALKKSAQASPICLPTDQGAFAKTAWPFAEAAKRGAAGRQISPSVLISDHGVTSERSPDRRARLDRAANLHGATDLNP